MLKGVQHQIVEIRKTDDPFFERALLFVRVECAQQPLAQLQQEGQRFLSNAKPYAGLRRNRRLCLLRRALYITASGLFGVMIGMIWANLG